MKSSDLKFNKISFPFATNGKRTELKYRLDDSEASTESELTWNIGFPRKNAHQQINGGALVKRGDINAVIHTATRIHTWLQDGGFMTLNKYGEDTTPNKRKVPRGGILPYIDGDSLIPYKALKDTDAGVEDTSAWTPLGSNGIAPNNSHEETADGMGGTYTAPRNVWIYVRSNSIPSYQLKINGQTVFMVNQNSTGGVRFHGTVDTFGCFLLKKGDVVTFPNVHIYYRIAPCEG